MENENIEKNEKEGFVENCYQGILVTETVLGNPNGSFVNNEPRNINGRVFTTDKCIKYNVRDYIRQRYEKIEYDKEKEKVKDVENFVFFYPRKSKSAKVQQAKYITKDEVFKKYFKDVVGDKEDPFEVMLRKSPDVRMFGGTFSFDTKDLEGHGGQLYGPIQISYGLDLIGADIIALKLGTPFASSMGKGDEGQQKTTGEEHVVDHAVIAYDITVNPNHAPNHAPNLLKTDDLKMLKEGLIQGTNLRRSTSKKTEAKVLVMAKFRNGVSVNVGELKHLIDVKSKKITDPKERVKKLVLDFTEVKNRLDQFKKHIEKIEVLRDEKSVEIQNFYPEKDDVTVAYKPLNEVETFDENDARSKEKLI